MPNDDPVVQYPRLTSELREFLRLHERALELYLEAVEDSEDPDSRERLSMGVLEIQRHLDLLESCIRDLDGNPVKRRSPPPNGTDLEQVVLVETQILQRWELLQAARPSLDDPHARGLITRLLNDAADEAEERLNWVQRQQILLLLAYLMSPVSRSQAA